MLLSARELEGFEIVATDGDVGTVEQFLFDDERWALRYVVVNTGSWLSGRQVLISPFSIIKVDREQKEMQVTLTRTQVEQSPDIDTHKPVSRQMEASHSDYYGYPYYWDPPFSWGTEDRPVVASQPSATALGTATAQSVTEKGTVPDDVHLRSTLEVASYHIAASDGEIGHVEDFIVEDEGWAIRYLAVDTRNWLSGRKVLISPRWISGLDWSHGKVHLNLSRDGVKQSPEYDHSRLPSREYEEQLHGHYGHSGYWTS